MTTDCDEYLAWRTGLVRELDRELSNWKRKGLNWVLHVNYHRVVLAIVDPNRYCQQQIEWAPLVHIRIYNPRSIRPKECIKWDFTVPPETVLRWVNTELPFYLYSLASS